MKATRRRGRGETSREVEALGTTCPFISCAGEEGGWATGQAAELHFEQWQSGACGRKGGLPSG